jgi:acyl-CoA reductase-like NAD-dependent aldehyde dehydrogenase
MNREFKLLIGGHWETSAQPVEIRSPFNGDVVGVTWLATPGDVESAIDAATLAFRDTHSIMKVNVMPGAFQKDQHLRNEFLARLS